MFDSIANEILEELLESDRVGFDLPELWLDLELIYRGVNNPLRLYSNGLDRDPFGLRASICGLDTLEVIGDQRVDPLSGVLCGLQMYVGIGGSASESSIRP